MKNNRYYDKLWIKEWGNVADYNFSSKTRFRIIMRLLKEYKIPRHAKILDCGCGTGNLLLKLKNKNYTNLNGSDFSESAISISKNKNFNRVFKADLTKLNSFNKRKFDVIICSEVLEHIKNDKLAIKNLFLMLNKEGILIISVPYQGIYWSQHDNFSGHIRRYEKNELENKLKEKGFNILESFGWGGLMYPIYHRILTKKSPSSVMGKKNKFIKKILSRILYFIFFIEDLSKVKKRARRIFIVTQKIK